MKGFTLVKNHSSVQSTVFIQVLIIFLTAAATTTTTTTTVRSKSSVCSYNVCLLSLVELFLCSGVKFLSCHAVSLSRPPKSGKVFSCTT